MTFEILNRPARRLHVVRLQGGPQDQNASMYVRLIYIDRVAIDFTRKLASLAIINFKLSVVMDRQCFQHNELRHV